MQQVTRSPSIPHAHRPPFARGRIPHGWASHSNSLAGVGLVLTSALEFGTANAGVARLDAALPATADERFDAAVQLYEDGHWEIAFDALGTLADEGHARAAKLVLLMLRYGVNLYGTVFKVKPQRVASWAQRVLRATSRATASPRSMTAIA